MAQGGNLKLLVSRGLSSELGRVQAWEEIVRKNYEANANFGYDDYTELLKAYASLLAQYNQVKAGLALCLFMVDDKVIKFLRGAGYRIDTSTNVKYIESINKAMYSSSNLGTLLQLKLNEINREYGEAEKAKPVTFEEMRAVLAYQIGFPIEENILLSTYNEYKKVLEKVAKAKQPREEIET